CWAECSSANAISDSRADLSIQVFLPGAYNDIIMRKRGGFMDRTEKQRAFIIHFLYFVIVAGLVLIFLKYVIYEIMPFLIGFAIAFLLQPLIRALARKSGV